MENVDVIWHFIMEYVYGVWHLIMEYVDGIGHFIYGECRWYLTYFTMEYVDGIWHISLWIMWIALDIKLTYGQKNCNIFY